MITATNDPSHQHYPPHNPSQYSFYILLLLMMELQLHPPLSSAAARPSSAAEEEGRRELLHPVVLMPGNGGNQLEARLTREYKPSSLLCHLASPRPPPPPLLTLPQKRFFSHRGGGGGGGCGGEGEGEGGGGWFRLWFDPAVVVVRGLMRCFAERMTLRYDAELDDYRNAPGVETRVPYFGSARGIRYLDPHLKHLTEYMATLVSSLERIGYRECRTLFGAPYDFRYGLAAPGHPSRVGTQYLADLKALTESAVAANGGRPAILVAHSLGGLFALQLLLRSPPPWRRRFIAHFVSLSTPWAGTAEQMLTFASGNALGVPLVDPLVVRAEQRSSESNLWLLPAPRRFGAEPIVHAAHINRSYSALQMPSFLEDIGFPEGVGPYANRVEPLTERLHEPGVPVTCIVGTGVGTPEKLFYGAGGFDARPKVAYGDGDGTVNAVSLLALESEWSGSAANQSLNVIKLPGVSHTGILKNGAAIKEIIGVINGINSKSIELVR